MSDAVGSSFALALETRARAVEAVLREVLGDAVQPDELARPARLLAAMRHGALNGGKRMRPFLLVESAALFGANEQAAMRVAAALECIHCYSLVHDDLPAMDNDDLRRGQPTVHKAFDDATAILAGDSLLTLAFDIVASPETALPDPIKVEIIRLMSRAAGLGGMAGGQALDLAAATTPPDEAGIITLQAMKTGALIRFACEAGAVIGLARPEERERLSAFGAAVGLAFQLADDLLDLTADPETVGKATGKDSAAGKATLAGRYGEGWARGQLNELVAQADILLGPFGERASILKAAALFVAQRDH